jgi:EAL domain-containing protein (putative c-di-GMP-specific phosphodiesterase class I)
MEVTEDVIVSAEARNSLLALRKVGIGISMDDFGTGYSSFALLATMPFDEIKIDRSFVQPLPDGDPTFRTLVSTIVDMTAALGVRVVAEGVETNPQREILRDMGCQHYQGYLGARPAPFSAINRFLVDRVAVPGD